MSEAPVEKKLTDKERRKMEREAEALLQRSALSAILEREVVSITEESYGHIGKLISQGMRSRVFTELSELTTANEGAKVWIRSRLSDSRTKSKSLVFIVLRTQLDTLQAVVSAKTEEEKNLAKFASSLPLESIVDVYGTLVIPQVPVDSTTIKLEMQIEKIFCVNKPSRELPFLLKDANRTDRDTEGAQVSLDNRLDNRIIDLRTRVMQSIVRISHETLVLFRENLFKDGFMEFHSPKLLGGTSEGGANVFNLSYFKRNACLAQSPQLYKQMLVSGDITKAFTVGAVFRAENSNTHRHLCEYTGVDIEMAFKEDYFEVCERIEEVLVYVCQNLSQRCPRETQIILDHFGVQPFRTLANTDGKLHVPKFSFAEGCKMLREAGWDIPEDISEFDISTPQEKALGKIIAEKYNTDLYYMYDYPAAVRPFYTMPNPSNPKISNSYDFFMRGEEILSGAQRIHDSELLAKRARECGIDPATISDYIDCFRYGAYPHGGCGIGLERVIMLYLGIPNIRYTNLFPRDPKRLAP